MSNKHEIICTIYTQIMSFIENIKKTNVLHKLNPDLEMTEKDRLICSYIEEVYKKINEIDFIED